jgi:large subunit ribosomal protein L4
MVLSDKAASGQLAVVDALAFPEGKTKTAVAFFARLAKATNSALMKKPTTLLVDGINERVVRAVRNLPTIEPCILDAVNAYTLLQHPYMVVTVAGVKKIEERFGKKQ